MDEYETYHYPEDDGKEVNTQENPVDDHNHAMTANMYVSWSTKHLRDRSKYQILYKPFQQSITKKPYISPKQQNLDNPYYKQQKDYKYHNA